MGKKYDLLIRARADTRDGERALRKLQREVRRTGQNIASAGRTLTMGLTAPLVAFAAVGVKEALEAQKVMAQTRAVIKSTGGAARVTAQQVSDLATSLSLMSGKDDEAIASMENVLLTFTKVQNHPGANGKVFDDATRAILDMSVALNLDMNKAAIQVGKALNDPVKGMTALRRVGVTFSAQQVDQVKAMVASNRTMDAQRLILRELNKEFGGSAKAFGQTDAGKIERAKVAFQELAAAVAGPLTSAIAPLTNLVLRMKRAFDGLTPTQQKWARIIMLTAAAAGPLLIVVGNLVTASAALAPVIAGISGPVAGAVAAFALFGAALVKAYRDSAEFRATVNGAFRAVRREVVSIVRELRKTLQVWGSWARRFWRGHGDTVVTIVRTAYHAIARIVGPAMRTLSNIVKAALALLRLDFKDAWHHILTAAQSFVAAIRGYIGNLVDFHVWVLSKLGHAVGSIGKKMFDWGVEAVKAFIRGIKSIDIPTPDVSVNMTKKKGIPVPDFDIAWNAHGGVYARPTIVGLGEAGPEAIVPLGSSSTARRDRARVMHEAGLAGSGGGGTVVNIAFHSNFAPTERDARQIANLVASTLTGRHTRKLATTKLVIG